MSDLSVLSKTVCDYINSPFGLFLSGGFLGLLILFISSFIPSLFRKNENTFILGLYKFVLAIVICFCAAIIFAIISNFFQASAFLTGILISAFLFSFLFGMKAVFLDTFLQLFNVFAIISNSDKADVENKVNETKKTTLSNKDLNEDISKYF